MIVGIVGVAVFLLLVIMGMWVGFAAALVGLVGIGVIKGWVAMSMPVGAFITLGLLLGLVNATSRRQP